MGEGAHEKSVQKRSKFDVPNANNNGGGERGAPIRNNRNLFNFAIHDDSPNQIAVALITRLIQFG